METASARYAFLYWHRRAHSNWWKWVLARCNGFRGSRHPHCGIPGTIDNDLGGTDFTLGFITAAETAVKAVRRLTDVALSERGIFFVEVMDEILVI